MMGRSILERLTYVLGGIISNSIDRSSLIIELSPDSLTFPFRFPFFIFPPLPFPFSPFPLSS